MRIKKYFTLVILIAFVFSLSGCKNSTKKTESVYNNDKFPSFSVENMEVSAGEDITVYVKLKDNPGFLTMAMNIEYDSTAMALIDIKNGPDYEEYNFVGPKNRASGCTASWFIPELPDKIKDGKLLELHFTILNNAKSGEYPIKITRPDNGGIVDAYKEILVVNNAIGYITVK